MLFLLLWLCGIVWSHVLWYLKSVALFGQDCCGYLRSFVLHMNFRIDFSISVKKLIGILIEIALNIYSVFSSIAIFTILILAIHEHGMSFHLLMSSFIMNSFSLWLSWEFFISPLILKYYLAGCSSLGWQLFSLMVWSTPFHTLITFTVSAVKSAFIPLLGLPHKYLGTSLLQFSIFFVL
jgi:hypothetical protein